MPTMMQVSTRIMSTLLDCVYSNDMEVVQEEPRQLDMGRFVRYSEGMAGQAADLPPGLPVKAAVIPVKRLAYVRPNYEWKEMCVLRVISGDFLQLCMDDEIRSHSHFDTNCDCFLGQLGVWMPSWPTNELSLHYAVHRLLSVSLVLLTGKVLGEICWDGLEMENLSQGARHLIVEMPKLVGMVEEQADIGELFRDETERRWFVEMFLERFIVYQMFQ